MQTQDSVPTFRPADKLALWLTLFLAAGVLLDALNGALAFVEWQYFPGFAAKETLESAGEQLMAVAAFLAAVATILVFLTTVVVYCFWLHRANSNARALGAQGMTFTPGWAVGYFFVPIANLYRPFRAVKEVYQASDPEASGDGWKSSHAPSTLESWWGAWLLSGFLGQASFRLSQRSVPVPADMVFGVDLASDAAGMAAGILCLVVVRAIQARQSARALRVGVPAAAAAEAVPPPPISPS